jgi:pimeloyl-ACP methyl ester carboxylesterase
MLLHGTTENGSHFLSAAFADQMFGPGQPLDAARYVIILPDSIGTGDSSKPSVGLRAKFPRYSVEDMVDAQYRLMTEGLGIRHLRLVLGNSMGGLQAWIWASRYLKAMDAVVPMASMPIAMSGRNWMTRRLSIDSVRNDPACRGGDDTVQPVSLQFASVMYGVAANGGAYPVVCAGDPFGRRRAQPASVGGDASRDGGRRISEAGCKAFQGRRCSGVHHSAGRWARTTGVRFPHASDCGNIEGLSPRATMFFWVT